MVAPKLADPVASVYPDRWVCPLTAKHSSGLVAVPAALTGWLALAWVDKALILRNFIKGDAQSEAVYSDCERYRYLLTRTWGDGPKALFVMLNPSTATEVQNDPTVERCERRARALGFGSFRVTNIFAFRATDPKLMRAEADPVGPGNDAAIRDSAVWADRIICAWGNHGLHRNRGAVVEALLRASEKPLFQFGLTGQGQPRHPLYVGYATQPVIWPPA